MRLFKISLLFALGVLVVAALPCQGAGIAEKIGVSKGICVLPGDSKCDIALELARETDLLLYVQLAGDGEVAAARRAADRAGLYGSRIFVGQGPLTQLNMADNVADVVYAGQDVKRIRRAEALRI